MPAPTLDSRGAVDADAPFIRSLFDQTREAELAAAGLDTPALAQLLDLQYRAHTAQTSAAHPEAQTTIIEVDGGAAGMLVVDRSGTSLHVVDIVVAEPLRSQGIGTAALQALAAEADATGRALTLDVWGLNARAIALYERLAFSVTDERSGYLAMRREAAA